MNQTADQTRGAQALTEEDRTRRRQKLLALHHNVGLDPRYLDMPEGQALWFVHVRLDRDVHCRGFTNTLQEYALGTDAQQAAQAVIRFLAEAAPAARPLRCDARPSVSARHPADLVFPEQVRRIDMPALPRRTPTRQGRTD